MSRIDEQLKQYHFPEDLKRMSLHELELLAVGIREFLLEHVSKTGGHLASNLGIVELTIALLRTFDPPQDKIIWDVGHQSYVYKILTGRAGCFDHLRQMGGISGFPRKEESPYDAFDTGHSSTSVSVAAGMAAARDLRGEDYNVVAVIGDGALTGGLAYEGLNNLGVSNRKSIIIINDNGMSINVNTGGVSSHLGKLRLSGSYYRLKKNLKTMAREIPGVGEAIYHSLEKFRDVLKYAMVDGVLFEEFGFTYLGPINGHRIKELMENLALARATDKPVVLHVRTQKGKGYRNAEQHPGLFHGIGPFHTETGMPLTHHTDPTFSEVFGQQLTRMAERDPRIVAISAAMMDGTGLAPFARQFPERVFDVGIAEGHAVTFAGGLAAGGMRPFVCIYSSFLQRAFDQILIDVCLQRLPVVFAVDRAGVVGQDGETHHGIHDLSYLSEMPGLTILAPADTQELVQMMEAAMKINGPCAIRYPKGSDPEHALPIAPSVMIPQVLKEGSDVEIWAVGNMVTTAWETAAILRKEGIRAGVINVHCVRPLNREQLRQSCQRTRLIVTLEDNHLSGGFGEHLCAAICDDVRPAVLPIGWPDHFIEHGTIAQLMEQYGMTPLQLAERIKTVIESRN